jgi:hypothetical protein
LQEPPPHALGVGAVPAQVAVPPTGAMHSHTSESRRLQFLLLLQPTVVHLPQPLVIAQVPR